MSRSRREAMRSMVARLEAERQAEIDADVARLVDRAMEVALGEGPYDGTLGELLDHAYRLAREVQRLRARLMVQPPLQRRPVLLSVGVEPVEVEG